MTTTSGNCAWIVYEPSPLPSVPGRLSELRPRHSHPGIADTHAAMSPAASMRLTACLLVEPSCPAVPGWGPWSASPGAYPQPVRLLPAVVRRDCSAPPAHPAASAAASVDSGGLRCR